MANDKGGFFGALMSRLKPGGGSGVGYMGTNIPTLPQTLQRVRSRVTGNPYGGGPPSSLMQSANQPTQQAPRGTEDVGSDLPSAGGTVGPYNGPQVGQPLMQSAHDNGWRNGSGGTGLGGGWTVANQNMLASLSDSGAFDGGKTGSAAGNGSQVRFNMTPEFGTEIVGRNGERTRGGDSRTIQRGPNQDAVELELMRRGMRGGN